MSDDTAQEALDVARRLADLGSPIFRAEPNPGSKLGFTLPIGWERAPLGHEAIDAWRPGDALAMVCGYTLDVIDVDPRNGGDESWSQLVAAGLAPDFYARADTPSGGQHFVVAALGIAKLSDMTRADGSHTGVAPGVDLQCGLDDGSGRGFVFLAPTVRVSKATGAPVAYEWRSVARLDEVDIDDIRRDDSGAALVERVRAVRATRAGSQRSQPFASDARVDDPFDTPARRFTRGQASAYVMPDVTDFAGWGEHHTGYNARLNELAVRIGHFVPAFMGREVAERTLYAAAERNGSVEYQGEPAVWATIRSGLGAGMREPYALDEADAEPATVTVSEAEPEPSAADLLAGQLLTAAQLRSMPRPTPLVEGLLDLDTCAWMIGKPGSYKSFVALDLAGRVGTGKDWHGQGVTRRVVVYLAAEGAGGMGLRTAAWETLYGDMNGVYFLPLPVQSADPKAWGALVEVCERVEAGLIVVDTQSRVTVGLEENSARDMGLYVDAAERLRRATGGCVLTVHHIGRTGTDARGSSAIDGAQSTELRIDRTATCRVTVHLDKQKDGDDSATFDLELMRVDGGLDEVTARDLSSLAVVPPGTAPKVAPVRDWLDNLTPNQVELIQVFADLVPAAGDTKAGVKTLIQERRASSGRPPMAKASYARAWDSLLAAERLARVAGSQRFMINDEAPSDEFDQVS